MPAATAALAAAATLAGAIERVSGDPQGSETVRAAMQTAPAAGAQAPLVAGLVQYARALERYDREDMEGALTGFRAAAAAFERADSPLRWSAALYVSICDNYEGRIADARRGADELGARDAVQRYPSLLARVHWVQGWIRAIAGDLSGALDHYQEALRLFEGTGESDGVASASFLIAEALDLTGDSEAAWRHRATALGSASRAASSQRRSIHLDATFAALAQGRPWAALIFEAPLFEPWSVADPGALSEAYETRARILDDTGDPEAALADLAAAVRSLAAIGDPGLRRRLEAELAASRATRLVAREPAEAIAALRQAIDYFQGVGAGSRLPALYLDRGRAHEALGEYREAEADYGRGVDLLERTHDALIDEPQRVSFLDRSWTLFDAIIDLEAGALASPDRAFGYAERARRTELIVARGHGTAAAGSRNAVEVDTVARGITGDRALVYLVLVRDRLLRWVFRDGRSEFRPQPVSIAQVDGLIDSLRRATEGGDERLFLDDMTALYDLLLRPIEDLLPTSGELYIVPDRRLDDVPYAALLDSRQGRYLVERFATALAPTAAFVVAPPRAAPPAGAAPRVLAVGNPAFDPARHPGLAPLPGAEAEARQVAALYPNAVLLVGREATAAGFLARIATADIIHFAGHAIVNDRYPLLSALVMAPEPQGDPGGLLTALDMQQAAAIPARLVVFGACRATGGGTERPGGAFSLARPFLAAGVPAIVGTQWAVGDRPAAAVMTSFHLEYRRGSSAVTSLRAAQLAALRGPDPETRSPLSWGAFQVNGTAAPRADHL